MKTLIALLLSSVAWADQTGHVGWTKVFFLADGGYEIVIRGGGAEELREFLASADGTHVTCTKEEKVECRFILDKEGRVSRAVEGSEKAPAFMETWTSTWTHRKPNEVVKLKLASDLARELQNSVLPLDGELKKTKNDLRCLIARTGFGKSGSLVGRARRCYVGFDVTGKALPAEELP